MEWFLETCQFILTTNNGKLYTISLLKTAKHREDFFVDSLLFANDAAFVVNSATDLQNIMDTFSLECILFTMSINAKMTVVLVQGNAETSRILVDGTALEVINKFCYLGSTVSNNLTLDADIDIRIGKAATMFRRLRSRVWCNKHLTVRTKMRVYQTCVLSILSYGAEIWTFIMVPVNCNKLLLL